MSIPLLPTQEIGTLGTTMPVMLIKYLFFSWMRRVWPDNVLYYRLSVMWLQVHILSDPRGATLEVCISRMKTRVTNPRFVLVSATAPNIGDIADWIRYGDPPHPTSVFTVSFLNYSMLCDPYLKGVNSLMNHTALARLQDMCIASHVGAGRMSSSFSLLCWTRSCFLSFNVMQTTNLFSYFVRPERVRVSPKMVTAILISVQA